MFSAVWELSTFALIGMGGPWELAIIGGIVLLLFGNRLPGAAKSLGQSFSSFKKGLKEGAEDAEDDDSSAGQVDKVESKD